MAEPTVNFLRVPLAQGGTWTRLDRLTDGRIMCCLCFDFLTRDKLSQLEDGTGEDVYRSCAQAEKDAMEALRD